MDPEEASRFSIVACRVISSSTGGLMALVQARRISKSRHVFSRLCYGVKISLCEEAEPPGVGPPEMT
jgi:hypothetical protein